MAKLRITKVNLRRSPRDYPVWLYFHGNTGEGTNGGIAKQQVEPHQNAWFDFEPPIEINAPASGVCRFHMNIDDNKDSVEDDSDARYDSQFDIPTDGGHMQKTFDSDGWIFTLLWEHR